MASFGCDTIACMQQQPLKSIEVWAAALEANESSESPWKLTNADWEFPGYWVDNFFLPEAPYKLFSSGKINAESVMIGTNSLDGILPFMTDTVPSGCSTKYTTAMKKHWDPWGKRGSLPDQVIKQYPCSSATISGVSDAAWQFALADGDYNLHCPAAFLSRMLQARNVSTYMYNFSVGPRLYDQACLDGMVPCCQEGGVACYGWASHGAELPFVFNTTSNACWGEDVCGEFVDPFSGDEPTLVRSMQEYWASFLATGVPVDRSGAGPAWPLSDQGIAVLRTPEVTISQNSLTDKCKFWEPYYQGNQHLTFSTQVDPSVFV